MLIPLLLTAALAAAAFVAVWEGVEVGRWRRRCRTAEAEAQRVFEELIEAERNYGHLLAENWRLRAGKGVGRG